MTFKLARFIHPSLPGARLGALAGDHIVDLAGVDPGLPGDLVDLIAGGDAAMVRARTAAARATAADRLPLADIRFLPPLRPGKIVCLGLNYAAHAAEGGKAAPEYPAFFLRSPGSLIAHGDGMLRPRVSDQLDFEAELAVVVGRRAFGLGVDDALDAVAGYSCFNDGTLRDYQRRSSQWTIGKNFDGTGAFGPWFVPAAELPAGAVGLKIESRLNGRVMQSDDTRHMLVPVAEALHLITEAMTLEAGDVVIMGTPAGVGSARKPPVWMKPGDSIEVEIERIGLLANRVVQAG